MLKTAWGSPYGSQHCFFWSFSRSVFYSACWIVALHLKLLIVASWGSSKSYGSVYLNSSFLKSPTDETFQRNQSIVMLLTGQLINSQLNILFYALSVLERVYWRLFPVRNVNESCLLVLSGLLIVFKYMHFAVSWRLTPNPFQLSCGIDFSLVFNRVRGAKHGKIV